MNAKGQPPEPGIMDRHKADVSAVSLHLSYMEDERKATKSFFEYFLFREESGSENRHVIRSLYMPVLLHKRKKHGKMKQRFREDSVTEGILNE